MTSRRILGAAAILGGLGVALGAFGAHAMRGRFPEADLAIFETAVRYQMYHAVALAALAAWADRHPHRLVGMGALLILVGVGIFAGSLYLLVFSGARWLGAVTPLGGVSLIAGWLAVAAAAFSRDG